MPSSGHLTILAVATGNIVIVLVVHENLSKKKTIGFDFPQILIYIMCSFCHNVVVSGFDII